MKRHLEGILIATASAAVMLILGVGPVALTSRATVGAQSTRVGGRDVQAGPEQWFKRVGVLNPNGGCDAALEYDALNVVHVTDCTDAANLRDMKFRNQTLTGTLAAVGPIYLGGTAPAPGSAGGDTLLTKTVTGIADAAATTVLTVTVPNAAHSATIPIILNGTLGAGGAVGANECTATAYGQIVLTRTAGVATVATATTLADTGSACVAGASTITLAYSVTAMTGAVGVTQTFNIQVTISHGTGSSTNHVAVVQADLLNANASGVTVS